MKKGFLPSIKRKLYSWGDKLIGYSAAKSDYDGNHELGHVLNSLLIESDASNDTNDKRMHDWSHNITAKALTDAAKAKVNNHKTSRYGGQDEGELFAEAFADVYENGEKARPLHIQIVKEYESKRGQLQANQANN
ncbi:MAG: hypothetical protein ACOYIB_01875 [Desulfosporosinus sp.]|jgi:hypothetical protein